MAQYRQQMAEVQNAALGAGLQQRESLLQVRTRLQLVCSSAHAMAVAEPAMTSLCKIPLAKRFMACDTCLTAA